MGGPGANYSWSVSGDTLTLAPIGVDRCVERALIWTGQCLGVEEHETACDGLVGAATLGNAPSAATLSEVRAGTPLLARGVSLGFNSILRGR
jgi:hypothetical protein